MRVFSWVLAAVAALGALLVFEAPARATESVAITTSGIVRRDPKGNALAPRIINGKTLAISQQDCLDDISVEFPLILGGLPTSNALQAWAGTSCTDATARTGANPTCWPIYPSSIAATTQAVNPRIRAQDIVGQIVTQPKNLTYAVADKSVCTTQALTSGQTTVNIFFIWVDGQSTAIASATAYPIAVKLLGPPAPTAVTAAAGGGLLKVGWTAPSGEKDLAGYYIYAQASGASDAATTSDASTLVCDDGGILDGGTDDSGDAIAIQVDASCTSVPAGDGAAASCGTVDPKASTSQQVTGAVGGGTVKGLVNGATYTVAVGAYDSFGNVGALSGVVCATPQETTGFWERYEGAGGTAGGGYCSLDGAGLPGAPAAAAFVFALAGLAALRRRKR